MWQRNNPGQTRTAQRAGFTLIELLIVIAIIALLAAILFPVFARARERERKSSCASNLKQIGTGLIQYAQDFDGFMPPSELDLNGSTSGGLRSWPSLMFPYIQNEQVFVCPSGERKASLADASKISQSTPPKTYCGVTNTPSGGGNPGVSKALRVLRRW